MKFRSSLIGTLLPTLLSSCATDYGETKAGMEPAMTSNETRPSSGASIVPSLPSPSNAPTTHIDESSVAPRSSAEGSTATQDAVSSPDDPTSGTASSAATPGEPQNASQTSATSLASEAPPSVGETSAQTDLGTGDVALEPCRVFLAGDSTVSSYRDTDSLTDQAGWGQMLHEYLDELVSVDNRAVGGTTARSYIDFGHLAKIEAELGAGDTLFVQFGTNDGNKTATYELGGETLPYYLDPATDYKTHLARYIDLAEDKNAHLIFVTPPPRNSAYCTGGNGTGGHAEAMRELATTRGIPLADLNARSVEHLKAICPAPTPEDFFLLRADGSVDGTHFQEGGARILAGLVADEVAELNTPLASYVGSRP